MLLCTLYLSALLKEANKLHKMKEINLLPVELKPKSIVLHISKILRDISIFGFILFVFFTLAVASLVIYYSTEAKKYETRIENLKTQVKSLEKTETRLVLTKDRLSKIKQIFQMPNLDQEVSKLESLMNFLPQSAKISDIKLSLGKIELSLAVSTNSDLTALLALLTAEGMFQKIEVSSFSFKPNLGYQLSFVLYN